jgi:hypothetical protein
LSIFTSQSEIGADCFLSVARWLAAGKYSIQSMEAGEGDITVSQLVKELLKREWSNEQYRQVC